MRKKEFAGMAKKVKAVLVSSGRCTLEEISCPFKIDGKRRRVEWWRDNFCHALFPSLEKNLEPCGCCPCGGDLTYRYILKRLNRAIKEGGANCPLSDVLSMAGNFILGK